MLKIVKYIQQFSAQCRTIIPNNTINKLPDKCNQFVRNVHIGVVHQSNNDDSNSKDESKITPAIGTKYEVFNDDNAAIILDIEEERDKMLANELDIELVEDAAQNIYAGLNTEHGKTGVFDIEDLVAVLKRDNAENIFVCTVPKELKYVDHLVVVTARSHRHMKALAEFVRKMYKIKRQSRPNQKKEMVPRIEGKNSDEWMAIDLGNIALHIFSANVRKHYDIEMLWSVGPEYDAESNKPDDPIFEMFDQHSLLFRQEKNTMSDDTNSKSDKI